MKILLNGLETHKSFVSYNDGLNFGRFSLATNELLDIKISIEKISFIATMKQFYNKIKKEIKFDDDQYNDSSVF